MPHNKIDQYVINKVKEKRLEKGMSQADLSIKMGFTDSFVSHVETPKRRDKYNLNHLNTLAKIFKCSIKDFLPDKPL
jgi:transcriptional regulator with XRE-family HTH domain